MTHAITDRQGSEWEVWVEDGVIIAQRGRRTRVYQHEVGFRELPSDDELTHIIRTYTPARRVEDEGGSIWLVSSEGRGGVAVDREAGSPRFGIAFNQVNGEGRHWHPTTELKDLDEYSDEELVEILGSAQET